MRKYAIVNPDCCDRHPISNAIIYNAKSVVGTIVAKSRTKAWTRAIELTGIVRPIVAIYSSLSEAELEIAEKADVLWTQPPGNPRTATNPNGGGKLKIECDEVRNVNLRLRLSKSAADCFDSQDNKSQFMSNLLEQRVENK